jgi:O-antigen/teichoic acid export membrane protein
MIIGFYALFYLNIDAFRALGKINISEVFRSILRHVVFLIFAVIIYRTNNAKHLPEALLLSFIILSIISTILVLKIFSKRIKENTKKVVVISKKEIFNKSYPMSISMIAFLFLQSTDILLLGAFNEFKDVAYYSRSVQLALLVSLVLHAVNTVYAPKIAELYTLKKYNTLNQSVRKATKLIFITSFLPILLLFFFANSFLKLFGDDYTQAAIALQVLMVGQIVNTFTGSVGMYMNMTNRQKVLQNILLITIVLNFILNFVLIPKYGMLGAAISTSFSTAGWNLFGCIYLYRNDKVKTYLH